MESARQKQNGPEKSGSCAIVLLIVGDVCYVVNVGDSWAILSSNWGANSMALSVDHKPSEEGEKRWIIEANGQIY